jgi:hypothetical protein
MSFKRQSPQPVVEGGTGAQTLTGVLTGNGTSAVTANAVSQYTTLVAGASNAVSGVAPSATAGIPLVSNGSSANPSYTTAVVAGGGTGATTFTAYALVTAGTTSTNPFQNVVGVGSAGQVLTSAGASALPVWSNGASVLTVTPVNHSTGAPYVVLAADQFISADVTAGVIQINLPNAPTTGRVITIKDVVGLSASSNITLTTVGGAVNIDGATSFVMNTAYQSVTVLFNGSTYSLM